MEAEVSAKSVWKMLGNTWILKDVNIEIRRGRLVLVTGPNGAGKSTFLKMVCGIWRPSRGTIRAYGKSPASREAKKLIGAVFHENVLYDELTVRENLNFYTKLHGLWDSIQSEIIELLGLNTVMDKKVGELSFGWRRRANIARALLHSPRLLVIDEPLTGLDSSGRQSVLEILESVVKREGIVLAASPTVEPDLLDRMETEVYTIKSCRLVRAYNGEST